MGASGVLVINIALPSAKTTFYRPSISKYDVSYQNWTRGSCRILSPGQASPCHKQRSSRWGLVSTNRRRPTTMAWQDITARVEVDAPLSVAWELWSDREGVNRWMPWIASIKILKDQPELSEWTLKYNAFGKDLEFSWLARNLQPIRYQKIHWRSLDGLPNRGAVRFYPRGSTSCGVELTISYEVPELLAGVASGLSPLVERILRNDLERFAVFAKDYQLKSSRK
uniref:Coenzyme Q-binding protein COQ10 START domain-containing protein n=1 Tax=Picea sitchensis TaxID=3332 RepID=A9NTJ7_PICSI|nr:unknown [Picea sitchensis]